MHRERQRDRHTHTTENERENYSKQVCRNQRTTFGVILDVHCARDRCFCFTAGYSRIAGSFPVHLPSHSMGARIPDVLGTMGPTLNTVVKLGELHRSVTRHSVFQRYSHF